MSQINLMSQTREMNKGNDLFKKGHWSGSLLISGIVIVVAFGGYFSIVFYRNSIQKEVAALEADSAAKRAAVSRDRMNRVADFSSRLSIIDDHLKKTGVSPNDVFLRIERGILPDVNVTMYEYDVESGGVKIKISADSFASVSRQIIALKASGGGAFSSVAVEGDTRVGSDGRAEAALSLFL